MRYVPVMSRLLFFDTNTDGSSDGGKSHRERGF